MSDVRAFYLRTYAKYYLRYPDCHWTTGGNGLELPCRFPFTYRGKQYNGCIEDKGVSTT